MASSTVVSVAVKIPDKMFFRIGEVGRITGVKAYILRYWESEFKVLRPVKNRAGQRVYRKKDVKLVLEIRRLLYDEKYTIAGAKRRVEELRRQQPAEKEQATQPQLVALLRKVHQELAEISESLK